MAITTRAAGMGYHKSENLATDSRLPWPMEFSKSVQVTFGGNQMSSFQNQLDIKCVVVAMIFWCWLVFYLGYWYY